MRPVCLGTFLLKDKELARDLIYGGSCCRASFIISDFSIDSYQTGVERILTCRRDTTLMIMYTKEFCRDIFSLLQLQQRKDVQWLPF